VIVGSFQLLSSGFLYVLFDGFGGCACRDGVVVYGGVIFKYGFLNIYSL